MTKKITIRALAVSLLAFALCFAGCSGKKGESTGTGDSSPAAAGKGIVAILETTQGDIEIEFYPDKAPEHVKNFIELAKSGYYDGTYFHRVFPGFMIQGGDPNTRDDDPANDGLGGHSYKGPGTFLKAEFNDVKHVRGIVSMARADSPNSAGSQFFIMVAAAPFLDGKYSAFGKVSAGMDVADKIVAMPGKPISGQGDVNPFDHQYIKRITIR